MRQNRQRVAQQELEELTKQFRRELFAFGFITLLVSGFILGIIANGWGFSWLFFVMMSLISVRTVYDLTRLIRPYLKRRRLLLDSLMHQNKSRPDA